jgi:hypothetical protein
VGTKATRRAKKQPPSSAESETPCKVRLLSPEGSAERLWAVSLGGGKFRLDNTPFFAYGVSSGDVVRAKKSDVDGIHDFVKVLAKSGHRTIRVVFETAITKDKKARSAMNRLVKAGCTFEGMNGMLFAVDVPPEVDFSEITNMAESLGLEWEYADPTYEEAVAMSGGAKEASNDE